MRETAEEIQLGTNNEHIEVQSLEEIKEISCQMVLQASRKIRIYTPDLEHSIYDTHDFREAISSFARSNKHSEVQILLLDTMPIVKRGHAILDLSRRLSSSINIRQAKQPTEDKLSSYLLADDCGYIGQSSLEEKLRFANFNDRTRAEFLISSFTRVWEKSYSPADIRSLPL